MRLRRQDGSRPGSGDFGLESANGEHHRGKLVRWDWRRLPLTFLPGQLERTGIERAGMIAVAPVIYSRWNPIHCLWASLFFGGAQALGPALQSVGVTSYYYLFNASPFFLRMPS
jgi:hypothetical protein